MSLNLETFPKNFRDIQAAEKRKTYVLIIPLFLIYLFMVIILYLPVRTLMIPFFALSGKSVQFKDFNFSIYTSFFSWTDVLIILLLSCLFLVIHWIYAVRYGTQKMMDVLHLQSPGKFDSRHKQYLNIVEEMRIASGLHQIQAKIIASGVYNSLALIDKKGMPVIGLTEGVLSEFPRDEIQAITAHEIAHIQSGDIFYIGFITSLVNTLHAMSTRSGYGLYRSDEGRTGLQLFYSLILHLSSAMMRLFSCFISRKREFIADAMAVEMTRNPLALARAIDKAHQNASDLGLFADGFTPLFIVAPKSGGLHEKDGFFPDLFSTHPPLKKRISLLLNMAHFPVSRFSTSEVQDLPVRLGLSETPSPVLTTDPDALSWKIRTPAGGWISGLSARTLVQMPWFTLATFVTLDRNRSTGSASVPKNLLKTGIQAKYIPEISNAAKRMKHNLRFSSEDLACPVCHSGLKNGTYEKILIRFCEKCQGKLVPMESIQTILIRQDQLFSESVRKKALRWYQSMGTTRNLSGTHEIVCPLCETAMMRHMYNAVYHVEIDTCIYCHVAWFDKSELELLQILVEEKNRGTVYS
jgi:heat shock protein HtpX